MFWHRKDGIAGAILCKADHWLASRDDLAGFSFQVPTYGGSDANRAAASVVQTASMPRARRCCSSST